uniref:Uncharacterized protein n=1 Tax=Amphimedon queenslandica TaxID=400682 RepID=A0A1X7VJP8_AMPQE
MDIAEIFLKINGKHVVTPNFHLHHHTSTCIIDYGPVYCFWLFRFEHFNGMLGTYHTNQKSIEVSLMRKFLDDTAMLAKAPNYAEHTEILKQISV